MLLTLGKKDEQSIILENKRSIYSIVLEQEEKLFSIYLKNIYEDEVLSFYQIKRWFNIVQPTRCEDFTIFEKDDKAGELHKAKDFFEIDYQGVYYRFFGGYHLQKRTIICFDREQQVAEFIFGEEPCVKFKNSCFNSLFGMLLYIFNEIIKEDKFSSEAFLKQYVGVYKV